MSSEQFTTITITKSGISISSKSFGMIEMEKVKEHKRKKNREKKNNNKKNIGKRNSSEHFIIEQLCFKLFKPAFNYILCIALTWMVRNMHFLWTFCVKICSVFGMLCIVNKIACATLHFGPSLSLSLWPGVHCPYCAFIFNTQHTDPTR